MSARAWGSGAPPRQRRALRLTGRVQPGLPDGRATLQRRTRSGGWAFVKRKALRTPGTDTSTYRFKVWRKRSGAFYRVKVSANDGGAHLRCAEPHAAGRQAQALSPLSRVEQRAPAQPRVAPESAIERDELRALLQR